MNKIFTGGVLLGAMTLSSFSAASSYSTIEARESQAAEYASVEVQQLVQDMEKDLVTHLRAEEDVSGVNASETIEAPPLELGLIWKLPKWGFFWKDRGDTTS